MEILAHSLWAAAVAARGEKALKKRISIPWFAFWGVFPDVLAFSLIIGWYAFRLFWGADVSDLPAPLDVEPIVADRFWIVRFTSYLYLIGHSAVVFALVFALISVMQRRIIWPMCGWLLHIVIDLFTHSYEIYPSPILFPVLLIDFHGVWWYAWWLVLLNYAALAVVYAVLFKKGYGPRLKESFAPLIGYLARPFRRAGK